MRNILQSRAVAGRRIVAWFISCAFAAILSFVSAPAVAETVKLGLLKVIPSAPIFIALERGYFTAEGLSVEPRYFLTGIEPASAAVSGDIDLAYVGLTAGFYSLAGQGALRIVAGTYREVSGFHGLAYVASTRAFNAGLRSIRDFQGHSVAITSVGSSDHYALGLLAEKYEFDFASIPVLPVQSIPNVVSALAGGKVDAGFAPSTLAIPLDERGGAKILGWVGEETPFQVAAIFAARKTTDTRSEMLDRFLRAFRRGAHDYHDAFVGPDEVRKDGSGAPEILEVLSKYLQLPSAQIALGIGYDDPDGRLDTKDVLHQIDWYKSHGMLSSAINGTSIIDTRYVIASDR